MLKCLGQGCKIREECLRYTSKPRPFYQGYDWFEESELHLGGEKCDAFWPNEHFIDPPIFESYSEWLAHVNEEG